MNIVLWVLQSLLAFHTLTGAIWKFSNPAQAMPSLKAIPPAVWISLSVIEIFCAIGLLLPAVSPPFAIAAPISAGVISTEMMMYCALHLLSGNKTFGPVAYWLVVAALCDFLVVGRLVLSPL